VENSGPEPATGIAVAIHTLNLRYGETHFTVLHRLKASCFRQHGRQLPTGASCLGRTLIALQLCEGALMNDAVKMKALPEWAPDELSAAWPRIPFKENTSRPGELSRTQPPPKPVDKPVEKPKVEKPKPVKKPEPVKKPMPPAPAAPAAPSNPAPAAPTPSPAPPAPAAAPAAPAKESAAISGLASLGNPPPEYPGAALRKGMEGRVILRIKVLPNGRAGSVEVTKSSGKQVLDDAAVETVRNWKFVPAKRGDTPIEGFATQTIDFKLPE
nr:protein TonB, putative [Tanacetum cinerariifolium]